MDTAASPTRADYLAKRCTHEEYYRAVNADGGVVYRDNPVPLADIKAALEAGDEHLNTIPLQKWDRAVDRLVSYTLSKAFKARGDYATLAGLVCSLKQAARDAALPVTL